MPELCVLDYRIDNETCCRQQSARPPGRRDFASTSTNFDVGAVMPELCVLDCRIDYST